MLAVAVTAAALAVTACGPKQGPAGTVVGKDRDWKASTKTYRYELTTRDSSGVEHEFRASKADYDACYHGSAYPKCTEAR